MPLTAPVHLVFEAPHLDLDQGRVTLRWILEQGDSRLPLTETFDFGPVARPGKCRRRALQAAIRRLHWFAGVSYWKVACRGTTDLGAPVSDPDDVDLLTAVYRDGLAELAWRNNLEAPWWPEFSMDATDSAAPSSPAPELGLIERALVPMGGGKDSLVALERTRATGLEVETVQVGEAALIRRVAERTGLPHRRIGRTLDPGLRALNEQGALNGHVPITAINAAALTVASLLWDFRYVVFANERSADTPTLEVAGRAVNHQWAKSLAFETAFARSVQQHVAADLRVFSLLRRDRELAVTREFAELEQYHGVFSSCNRNFHLDGPRTDRWCGVCPKCRFVFLALAPYRTPAQLRAIFGRDLLAEPAAVGEFAELLELDGHRPFECVGEADEARAAVRALAQDDRWSGHAVIAELDRRLNSSTPPTLAALCRPEGPDCIPERFRALAPV